MTGNDVQQWLDAAGRTRPWLAKQLGLSLRTVQGWFGSAESTRAISPVRERQILELMSRPVPGADTGCVSITLNISEEEWQRILATFPEGVDAQQEVAQQMLAFIRAARLPR